MGASDSLGIDEKIHVVTVMCRWCGAWVVKGGFDANDFPHLPDCEAPW